jgi:hypothetical protein
VPTGCTTTKFASIKARRIRVTAVDSCGAPVVGECSTIVTSGFVSVGASAQVEDGQEFTVKNAWGEFCINEKDDSRVKRWDLTITLCEVDPQLLALLSGGRVFAGPGSPPTAIGGTFGETVGTDFALELWTKVAGGSCAEAAGGGAASWIYWVFPHVKGGVIGDLTFENGPLSMVVTANTQGAGSDWGLGPYTPAVLPEALLGDEHVGYVVTSSAPPDDTCGCEAMAGTAAVGAGAGTPGTWSPPGSTPPADAAAAEAAGLTATPNSAWTTGQYVQGSTAGTAGEMHWDGTAWVAGMAP